MEPNTNTAVIESLRTFAVTIVTSPSGVRQFPCAPERLAAFAHMCTAALSGEKWAVKCVTKALEEIADLTENIGWSLTNARLFIIDETDTTRPDGAIARSIQL